LFEQQKRNQIQHRNLIMEKGKILIVEDEAIIAMEIENQLQSLGYEVTSIVDTGEKAIRKAEEDKPDLMLMDIRIKGEMDGIDTAEEIRNRFGIPVIFSTAYLDEERIDRAKITMPFGYVLKPIQERDLRVTIEMALYVAKSDRKRKKAEEKLRESHDTMEEKVEQRTLELSEVNKKLKLNEERFKIALKNSSIIVAQVDLDLRYNWIYNPHADFDPKSLIGKRDDEIAQNDGVNQLIQLKQKVIDTGIGARKSISFPLTNGKLIYDVTAEPLKKNNGDIIGVTTASMDISDRKQ
jgi:CheY-like chemotaxis protein